MIKINTALAATSAAVGIGKAIGDLHDQKADLVLQERNTRREQIITEAIQNRHNPYEIQKDENGDVMYDDQGKPIQRLVGFGGYKLADGTTLADFDKKTVELAEGMYWTTGGKARGRQIAETAFEKMELNAQRQLAGSIFKEQEEVLNQQLANAIQTRDYEQGKMLINAAPGLSDNQREAKRLELRRSIEYEIIKDEAARIAVTEGTIKANEFLEEQVQKGNINKGQITDLSLAANRARVTAVKPEQDRLNGIWETRTANALTPEQAQQELNVLQSQQRAFEKADNEDSYYTYVQRLLSKGARLGGSGMSETQINDHNAAMIKAAMDEYESGKIGIDEAYAKMDSLERTRWTIGEVEKRYIEMLEYKDPLTARAYERAEQLCQEYKVDDRIKNNFMQGLIRTFTNNEIDRKDRLEYVEKFMTKQTAEYLNKALTPGASWSRSYQQRQYALSYEGKLDPFYTPVGKHGQQEMTVAGADRIRENNLVYSRDIVKDTLKGTDLEYVSHEFERSGENNETSRIFHTVRDKDGNTYKVIVNPQGRLEYADDLSPFDGKIREGNESLVMSMREKLSDEQNRKIDKLARAVNTAPHPRARQRELLRLHSALKGILGENYDKTDEGKAFEKYVLGRHL